MPLNNDDINNFLPEKNPQKYRFCILGKMNILINIRKMHLMWAIKWDLSFKEEASYWCLIWFFVLDWLYGVSAFVGYLMPNSFLYI